MHTLNKKLNILLILILLVPTVLASGWYKGTLHTHTGFSTWSGYDGDLGTTGDIIVTNSFLKLRGGIL